MSQKKKKRQTSGWFFVVFRDSSTTTAAQVRRVKLCRNLSENKRGWPRSVLLLLSHDFVFRLIQQPIKRKCNCLDGAVLTQ